MSLADSVIVSVDVELAPEAAFRVFTEDIDSWYRKDRHTLFDAGRTLHLMFEPFAGGRLLEVYDHSRNEGRELARVTRWEPGRLLEFTDNHETDIKVTFDAIDTGTRVTLVHSGFERVAEPDRASVRRYGWTIVVEWYTEYASFSGQST